MIDVRSLVGSTTIGKWPASPEITAAHVQAYEQENGTLNAGDVVLFRTGPPRQAPQAAAARRGVWADPLLGKSEGWPAPGPDAIVYLKSKGIRCVATDAPDLGGVDPKRALFTYWSLGSHEMVGVEFLHHVGEIPTGGYFLFAPAEDSRLSWRTRTCHRLVLTGYYVTANHSRSVRPIWSPVDATSGQLPQ